MRETSNRNRHYLVDVCFAYCFDNKRFGFLTQIEVHRPSRTGFFYLWVLKIIPIFAMLGNRI